MDKRASELWANVLQLIEPQVTTQTFQTWFLPIKASSYTGDTVTIEVPNEFVKNWLVDHHYTTIIESSVKNITGQAVEVKIQISKDKKPEHKAETESKIKKSQDVLVTYLNPKYTFDSFVVGQSNRFAHAASLAIAESPAKAYNPLFIYGGVGLGKTHLMQAIGHFLLNKNRDTSIIYVSSETFTNQLINAIQNRTTQKFREKFRTVDILLIDDIHFIAGKESTQEAFFHTFNALYDAHKQIVVSSDRPPKEIPYLEERLISRFEWGLVTDIQPPDFETRAAIMKKKVEKEKIKVGDDVIFFIADKIKSNIRELEGALIRVVAYSSLFGKDISIELVQDVLKDSIQKEEDKKINIEYIQKIVARYFNIQVSDVNAKKKVKSVSFPRQIAMYLTRELTDYSFPEIGDKFGGRGHATVIHACSKVRNRLKEDVEIKKLVEKLISEVKNKK